MATRSVEHPGCRLVYDTAGSGTRRSRRHPFLEIVMPPSALRGSDRDALAERLAPLFGHDLADHPAIELEHLDRAERAAGEARP